MSFSSKSRGYNTWTRDITRALGGCWYGSYGMARCPAHPDRNPSLSIREWNGKVQFHCYAGCTPAQINSAFRTKGLPPSGFYPPKRRGALERPGLARPDERMRTQRAVEIWMKCEAASGTPVEKYLRGRQITVAVPDVLRFHPSLKHSPSGQTYPAMVALVTNAVTADAVGIHRTFLSLDGTAKAPVKPDKMMLGTTGGAVVRLALATDSVMIGEGIETVLSAMQATGEAAWAALSASGLRTLQLPSKITRVIVLADGDEVGEAAAQHAARRWRREGRRVSVVRCPRGQDFNDILCG